DGRPSASTSRVTLRRRCRNRRPWRCAAAVCCCSASRCSPVHVILCESVKWVRKCDHHAHFYVAVIVSRLAHWLLNPIFKWFLAGRCRYVRVCSRVGSVSPRWSSHQRSPHPCVLCLDPVRGPRRGSGDVHLVGGCGERELESGWQLGRMFGPCGR